MAVIDSQSDKRPDTQDLVDILIDQLPSTTESERMIKETMYRLTEKLKEIFDYYDQNL